MEIFVIRVHTALSQMLHNSNVADSIYVVLLAEVQCTSLLFLDRRISYKKVAILKISLIFGLYIEC